jgi:hypothetical protein
MNQHAGKAMYCSAIDRTFGLLPRCLTLPYGVDATQLDQCVTHVGSGPQPPAVVAQLKPSGTIATLLFLPWLATVPMPVPLAVPHACGEPGPARYLSAQVKRRQGPASTQQQFNREGNHSTRDFPCLCCCLLACCWLQKAPDWCKIPQQQPLQGGVAAWGMLLLLLNASPVSTGASSP